MRETTDRTDPGLKQIQRNGQQAAYLVLSKEERKKGFVRTLRRTYRHLACDTSTTMALGIAETYARAPGFYSGTFCVACGTHFKLRDPEGRHTFVWEPDGSPVGS